MMYTCVAQEFLTHWKPEPVNPHKTPDATASELEAMAVVRLHNVRLFILNCVDSAVDA